MTELFEGSLKPNKKIWEDHAQKKILAKARKIYHNL